MRIGANWPSALCSHWSGLHDWREGSAAIICIRCKQYILYEECAAYQRWSLVWRTALMAGTVAYLN